MKIDRRKFIKSTAVFSGALISGVKPMALFNLNEFKSKRPPARERNFTSGIVEQIIAETASKLRDKELAWMFENCFPNTLDTTVKIGELNGRKDTFVITGDINAMWLRDSTAQVWPYLPFVNEDEKLRNLIEGVINRQAYCINIDPYANAFNYGSEGSYWESDHTDMKKELHERKWEVDSLAYHLRLSVEYWNRTGEVKIFDSAWLNSFDNILKTFEEQQGDKTKAPYKFQRTTANATDTLPLGGYGYPTKPVGLVNSAFRPSDDATVFSFLIPSNLFASKVLGDAIMLLEAMGGQEKRTNRVLKIKTKLDIAIKEFAVAQHNKFGKIYAYEVDGYGNAIFMDDANVPSLLALPYLGIVPDDDEIYLNTRRFVLSEFNPFFFKGKYAEGIGGPHVGLDMIWPMSIIMRAITSESDEEIIKCIDMLKNTHAGTGFMHESFHKDNPANYTRDWFAWANTLFGELILKILKERPHILT